MQNNGPARGLFFQEAVPYREKKLAVVQTAMTEIGHNRSGEVASEFAQSGQRYIVLGELFWRPATIVACLRSRSSPSLVPI